MNKRDLATHIETRHPEHLWPVGADLLRWSKDELEVKHAECHRTQRESAAGEQHTHTDLWPISDGSWQHV